MFLHFLLLFSTSFSISFSAPQPLPNVNEMVSHREHEIPEEDIITLPVGRFPEPTCEYRSSKDAPLVVHSVQIGDPVYHKWQCKYPNVNMGVYCMVVYNCSVSDSQSRPVMVIDTNGCSIWPKILPQVEYSGDLLAGVQTHVFALDVQRPKVQFNCAIRLMIKYGGECPRPVCQSSTPPPRISRRELEERQVQRQMDDDRRQRRRQYWDRRGLGAVAG